MGVKPIFYFVGPRMDVPGLIEQVVSGLGYELVDFETSPQARLLRVFIDVPRGITVDDCATVSNQLTRLFEVEGVDYDRLEVSSPGLDRALKKAADFERFAGQQIQIRTRMPVGNQRNFRGILRGLAEGSVLLEADAGVLSFPLGDVEKARLVPEF